MAPVLGGALAHRQGRLHHRHGVIARLGDLGVDPLGAALQLHRQQWTEQQQTDQQPLAETG
ncbi:MAG: hypothetical protein ACKO8I_11455 [Cyanobacteriota bacterium]